MATERVRGNTVEIIVKRRRLLGRPVSFTFDLAERDKGRVFVKRLEDQLDRGIVPEELRDNRRVAVGTFEQIINAYKADSTVSRSSDDESYIDVLLGELGKTPSSEIGFAWAEQWVTTMKREANLAPSTIRHRVGTLARCFDWGMKRGMMPANPLRSLGRGYATYSPRDRQFVIADGGEVKEDTERDRRLNDAKEEKAIREALAVERRHQAALEFMFTLALESAMRMREMFTLGVDQADVKRRTFFLERTKNGHKRQVPMTSVAIKALKAYAKHVEKGTRGMEGFKFAGGRLFPWWSGELTKKELERVTSLLSHQYARLFESAGSADLHFHDLRHEATSRLFERTTLSEVQIAKITGHSNTRTLMRYANLRGSQLAEHLW